MIRKVFVFLHRWVGLALALFLIIEGLTGSLLAFRGDLTRFFDPALAGAPPIPGAPKLDLATLIERAKALEPRASYGYRLPIADDTAIMKMDPRIDPATGKPYDLGFTYLALDPWTGTELKRLQHGMYTHGFLTNVMPFVYDLHKTLILNHAGEWILSILALLWTIDCFVGFYLTLPHHARKILVALDAGLARQMARQLLSRQFRPAPRRGAVAMAVAPHLRLVERSSRALHRLPMIS